MPQTKLYIGNLPDDVNKEDLQPLFGKYGNIVEFDILKDYGFIHYDQESEAKAAAAALDGQLYRGQNIKVEVSRSKVRQKAGMGGKGECYRCGAEGHWSKECPRGPSRDRRGGSDGGRGGGRGGRSRFGVYDGPPPRDPYFPDPYEMMYRRSALAYDRISRYDPYERRLPPLPRDPYRDPYRADYYRPRSPPPARDPYYDFYDRRRSEAQNGYWGTTGASSGGAASGVDDIKSSVRNPLQARVPGPY